MIDMSGTMMIDMSGTMMIDMSGNLLLLILNKMNSGRATQGGAALCFHSATATLA